MYIIIYIFIIKRIQKINEKTKFSIDIFIISSLIIKFKNNNIIKHVLTQFLILFKVYLL